MRVHLTYPWKEASTITQGKAGRDSPAAVTTGSSIISHEIGHKNMSGGRPTAAAAGRLRRIRRATSDSEVLSALRRRFTKAHKPTSVMIVRNSPASRCGPTAASSLCDSSTLLCSSRSLPSESEATPARRPELGSELVWLNECSASSISSSRLASVDSSPTMFGSCRAAGSLSIRRRESDSRL